MGGSGSGSASGMVVGSGLSLVGNQFISVTVLVLVATGWFRSLLPHFVSLAITAVTLDL